MLLSYAERIFVQVYFPVFRESVVTLTSKRILQLLHSVPLNECCKFVRFNTFPHLGHFRSYIFIDFHPFNNLTQLLL